MLDCHCHLLDITNFSSDTFLLSINKCHVERIYCNSVEMSQWSLLSTFSKQQSQIIPFFGLHPWHLDSSSFDALSRLVEFLSKPFTSCGEIGLDRHCDTDFSLQKEIFIRQLEIAKDTKSFVAIHCVKAWGPLLEILTDYQNDISFMIHSFNGSYEVMERIVTMGGMISFSDRILQNNQRKLQEVLKKTPLENLLLESDFPFQSTLIGSSPKIYCQLLTDLYTFVARLRGISFTDLIQILSKNGSICTY